MFNGALDLLCDFQHLTGGLFRTVIGAEKGITLRGEIVTQALPEKFRRLLITGAAGQIGSVLRPALRETAERIRLHDVCPLSNPTRQEELMSGDLTVPGIAESAMQGVDCVIHLAGIARETGGSPRQILEANVIGTQNVYEAARLAGVKRFIFASSNHVIGFYRANRFVGPETPCRPSGHYGVSKVFGEAMGRLYADKYGMEIACLRIGAFRDRPGNLRELGGWISPRDMVRLVRCCVEAPPFHFLVIYGVSANTRNKWGDDGAARGHVGYVTEDNAEDHAPEVESIPAPGGTIAGIFHGGSACAKDFCGDPARVD
jgi:uronate dehydrogenase